MAREFILEQAGKNTFYIDAPAKIGLVRLNDQDVCLIDSGNDKDAGRKIRQLLEKNGWKLKSIYNTHSNADHIGGNQYLQNQTGCSIYAPGIEADFTRHPLLEPSFLYGGYPFKELRNKFLMAKPSHVQDLSRENLEPGFEIIDLPGHFFDMVGFRTPDNVVFLADCLSSKETLEKYQISFIYDVAAYLKTLDKIESLEASLFIPSHAAPTTDIKELSDINRKKVYEIAQNILDICQNPSGFEDILAALFNRYNLAMNAQQYALTGSTIRSYLSWLKDLGYLDMKIMDNRMLFETVKSPISSL